MNLAEIPGYPEAVQRERFLRNAAFLPVGETVAGLELQPLTLGHVVTLEAIGSPFILGGSAPTPGDIGAILWLLHPRYSPTARWRRWRFTRSIRRLDYPTLVKGISEFINEAFADSPGGGGAGRFSRSYYSLAAAIVGMLASEYGWSEAAILALPMKRIWQYRAEIVNRKSPTPVLFNPSDSKIQTWLNRRN